MLGSQRLKLFETRLTIGCAGLKRYFERQPRRVLPEVHFGVEVSIAGVEGPFAIFLIGNAAVTAGMAREEHELRIKIAW